MAVKRRKVKKLLLAPKGIRNYEAKEFKQYIVGMYERPPTKGSQEVEGVGITFGTRTVVRVKRDPKYVTKKEIKILAEEYGKSEEELTALFSAKQRKIEVRT